MADLQEKASQRNKPTESWKPPEKHGVDEYECNICKDTELIIGKNEKGYDVATFCECKERNAWKRRFKQSMLPEEFRKANFENYVNQAPIQKRMIELTKSYQQRFDVVTGEDGRKEKIIPPNNFGLVAVFGEQRIKELPVGDRTAIKQEHNNFGIGKTHLQIALAKQLIKQGFSVLIISDAVFMDDLMQARRANDEGESLNKLLYNVLEADVVVWDDMGKAKWTEPKESMYYRIINERYRKQKPIVFNSNEDRGTLAEKIGYAAASRLIGGCWVEGEDFEYLLDAEGQDWRLKRSV
ncbi:DNA replication protein [Domibacillus aminovorans]|uniref:DNA replication protein n=2 Tax=Domibacillus aminovorans TaxID=29332 RepID=A0A177KI84_9BACI|nr:DNA replication protein [Domibacillus aminovorans]